jgi:hypothetical protein
MELKGIKTVNIFGKRVCPAIWAHPSPFDLFSPGCDTNELLSNLK